MIFPQEQCSTDMSIFDSHAHYDDCAFDEDRAELLSSLFSSGKVSGIINVGASLRGCYESVALSKKYESIYAAVGLHPEYADKADEASISEVIKLIESEKIVAVGEIGLDYHYDDGAPCEIQKKLFEKQIEIAKEYSLPIIVHDRDAHADTLEILKKYKPKGVVHCFSASAELMEEAEKIGMYIGLGGAVTFKNARKPKLVAAAVREDRLLLETDCPYMAPVPNRGKRCDSSMIEYTAKEIAQIRGIDFEKLISVCADNAKELFNI